MSVLWKWISSDLFFSVACDEKDSLFSLRSSVLVPLLECARWTCDFVSGFHSSSLSEVVATRRKSSCRAVRRDSIRSSGVAMRRLPSCDISTCLLFEPGHNFVALCHNVVTLKRAIQAACSDYSKDYITVHRNLL